MIQFWRQIVPISKHSLVTKKIKKVDQNRRSSTRHHIWRKKQIMPKKKIYLWITPRISRPRTWKLHWEHRFLNHVSQNAVSPAWDPNQSVFNCSHDSQCHRIDDSRATGGLASNFPYTRVQVRKMKQRIHSVSKDSFRSDLLAANKYVSLEVINLRPTLLKFHSKLIWNLVHRT